MARIRYGLALAGMMLGLAGGAFAQTAAPPTPPKAEAAKPVDMTELLKAGPLAENTLGREDAPVTIVEYASLTCPHCATFHNKTLPALKRDYINTGKVRLIFRDFPFDMVAMGGAMVARCAQKDKYFDILADLFTRQEKWAFSDDPEKNLKEIAFSHGFTQETFDACLQKQEIYDGILAVRKRGHEAFQVDSTPTLIINGVMHRGALSPEQMETALKPHLDKK